MRIASLLTSSRFLILFKSSTCSYQAFWLLDFILQSRNLAECQRQSEGRPRRWWTLNDAEVRDKQYSSDHLHCSIRCWRFDDYSPTISISFILMYWSVCCLLCSAFTSYCFDTSASSESSSDRINAHRSREKILCRIVLTTATIMLMQSCHCDRWWFGDTTTLDSIRRYYLDLE